MSENQEGRWSLAQETPWILYISQKHHEDNPALPCSPPTLVPCPPHRFGAPRKFPNARMQCHNLLCPSQVELPKNKVVLHPFSLFPSPGLLLSPITFSSSQLLSSTLQTLCQGAQGTENWPYKDRISDWANTAP